MTGSSETATFAVLVTIDTEADNAWERSSKIELENTRRLGELHRFLEERGAIPTYLVTHEVASDPRSAAILGDLAGSGRAEVGAHLHPWTNPPFHRLAEREWECHPYPHEYPDDVFEAKMVELGRVIEERIGVVPRSYRAGRWGFKAEHGAVLRRLGYVVDTSVTPGVSWERYPGAPGGQGGPSYVGAPRVPYRLHPTNAVHAGGDGLPEVPVSIEWNRSPGKAMERILDRVGYYSVLARAMRATSILRPVWLRPYKRFSEPDLERLCRTLRRRHRPVWNIMFHSSEAIAGCSPYSRDEFELRALYGKLDLILARARELGARFVGLSDFATGANP